MQDLTRLSAAKITKLIPGKNVSPLELVRSQLDRIGTLNPSLNAVVRVDAERGLAGEHRAEAGFMRDGARGSVYGVPISIKSSINVAGLPGECGSKLRAGNIPDAQLAA